MGRKDGVRNAVQAAGELNERWCWKRFTNFDCFAIKVSAEDTPILGTVLGGGGEEYGLSLFRGPQAAASFSLLLRPGRAGDELLEGLDLLGFSMTAFADLSPEGQALFREAGLHPRYDEQVPGFLVKPSGQRPRVADESDLALLLPILRGIVAADKKKLLQPARLESKEGICVLTIRGDPSLGPGGEGPAAG